MDQFTLLPVSTTSTSRTPAAAVATAVDFGQRGSGLITQNECRVDNDYDGGQMELRIASIFVILVCSSAGACFPIFARQHAKSHVGRLLPSWSFFAAKFFGSGVIIATAFIHLLSPAEDALRHPCITGAGGILSEYDWVSGIMLITTFVLFCVEVIVMRYSEAIIPAEAAAVAVSSLSPTSPLLGNGDDSDDYPHYHQHNGNANRRLPIGIGGNIASSHASSDLSKDDDGGMEHHHQYNSSCRPPSVQQSLDVPDPKAQLAAILILEFGVIFHSVFIGLTLAVSGDEFFTLFIVMIFHQTFEGLGLGARLAVTPWPRSRRRWTPYALGLAFGLTTPIAIALGLVFRNSYPPGSRAILIVNGVFDSISAGILNYTGLIELMAREVMFSPDMQNAPLKTLLSALGLMILGAGLMALLGKWA